MGTTYTNPIISGFAPDPSVVFVDNTFFLVNSSFHIFPGLPIYASKNLQEWTQIGNAFSRTSQIDLSNATTDVFPIGPNKNLVAALGLFAPTIRWHNGVFYIICTNTVRPEGGKLRTDNFFISTTDIWANKWSDPIWFDLDGIDASLFFDDVTGKVYVQGSYRDGEIGAQKCSIRQFEIDITTGKKLSDTRPLWGYELAATSEGISDIEGPHLYKKDGYYYLLAADGGTFETHRASIARSRDIWGPYEVYENNPVLTAAGTDEYIQNVGHADLFHDGAGTWWAVCLGVRNETGGRSPIGRETFLIPVEWPVGEWPVFGRAKMQFERDAMSPQLSNERLPRPSERVDDVYIRDANLSDYEFSEHENSIKLTPSENGLSAAHGTATFIGKRQRLSNSIATAILWVPTEPHLKAGLSLFKENARHVDICYDTDTKIITLDACLQLKGEPEVIGQVAVTAQKVQMKISSSAESYEFFTRTETSEEWVLLGSIDALDMTACDFTGTFLGIFAVTTSPQQAAGAVRFEDFVVS
ncbi:xylosidase/arabinosidase [Penicillium malachiteum]|uniref:Xylosidase/arabinosidase n=1 Tax=Penicillium malachiteum TaxID=1324776 RepID=A0AAD6HPQ8_9EURO|nr:xylosidase/arabinosidase [Penicillium malachiteum]